MSKQIINVSQPISIVVNTNNNQQEQSFTASSPLLLRTASGNTPGVVIVSDDPKYVYKSDPETTDEGFSNEKFLPDYLSEHDSFQKINAKPEPILGQKAKIQLVQKLLPSTLIATGTGLAMMPIFNHLVKNSEIFGINIHSDKNIFAISTANTFIVASFSSFSTMYHFIQKYQHQMAPESQHIMVTLGKIGASCSVILPLGLLWGIELQNQKIAGSTGFDEFVAWATFTTTPLIIDRIVESLQTVNNIYESNHNIELNSVGSKLAVYGLAGLSVTGRALAYTEAAQVLGIAMGMDPQFALATGIVAGGILGSAGITLFEYNAIKSLFAEQKEPMTVKKALCGAVSTIEGAWFTLPIISLGLQFADNWNPLLKGMIFTPLFVSHTVLEATRLYNNIMMTYDDVVEGIDALGCCDSNADVS